MALVVVILIAISSGGTLYVTGALDGSRFGEPVVYKRMTLMDAQLLCEDKTRKELGRRIHDFAIDNHSSRYDDYSDRFMMFFTANLYEDDSREGFSTLHFINCYTRSDREQVSNFEVEQDAELQTRPIRARKGGAFGY